MSRETTSHPAALKARPIASSLGLMITTSATKHAQARARLKQFRMLGPIFVQSETEKDDEPGSMWNLGEVRSC